MPKWWYLQPFDNTSNSTNLSEPDELFGLLNLLIELIFMYDDEIGTLAQARTLNLNEELGQYGTRASDVELAAAKKLSETWPSGNEEDCKSFIRQRIATL
ncbi:hypothetical protein KY289_008242 [Solanum tuberosum]|nr:hypothetical protein KY289_008242 [Solanum tuberosum]